MSVAKNQPMALLGSRLWLRSRGDVLRLADQSAGRIITRPADFFLSSIGAIAMTREEVLKALAAGKVSIDDAGAMLSQLEPAAKPQPCQREVHGDQTGHQKQVPNAKSKQNSRSHSCASTSF